MHLYYELCAVPRRSKHFMFAVDAGVFWLTSVLRLSVQSFQMKMFQCIEVCEPSAQFIGSSLARCIQFFFLLFE